MPSPALDQGTLTFLLSTSAQTKGHSYYYLAHIAILLQEWVKGQ